jgi:aryl-alcohol dehydrogenase-like predicted oxidoreductase
MVSAGADAFDCTDCGSDAEELLGALRRRLCRRPGAGADRLRVHTALAPDRDLLPKLTRQWVVDRIDRSLVRLGVERLHLVQLHWWDFGVAGYVAVAQWLDELRRAGKIGELGVANFDVPHLAKLLDAGVPVISNLVSYSLMDRRPENGMVELCRERNVRLLAYGSLAGGFLSARYESSPVPPTSLADANLTRYRLLVEEYGGWTLLQDLLDLLRRLAEKHGGLEPETVAARYVLERDQVAALLLGSEASAAQVQRLFTFSLDDDDYAALDTILSYAEGPRGDVFVSERSPDGAYASVLAPTRSERGW